MTYSAVVPTRSEKNLQLFLKHFLQNAHFCDEVLVLWNGSRADYTRLRYTELGQAVEMIPASGMDVYEMYNFGVRLAKNEHVLLVNDDMIVSPGFDRRAVERMGRNTVVTFTVVEPGYVDVNHKNVHLNFGFDVDDFDYEGFVKWNLKNLDNGAVEQAGLGWYMPVIFHKDMLAYVGYYPTDQPFPAPNDITLFDRVAKESPTYCKMAEAVYHFQRLSQRG